MSVNCNDFLIFAKSLSNKSEINNRNAASRSYYAAYHKCVEIYNPNNDLIGEGGLHEKLIKHLEGGCDKKEKELSYQMNQGRKLRVIADYKLDIDFTKSDRETAIYYSEEILKLLNN